MRHWIVVIHMTCTKFHNINVNQQYEIPKPNFVNKTLWITHTYLYTRIFYHFLKMVNTLYINKPAKIPRQTHQLTTTIISNPCSPPSKKKLTLLSRHHHRYFENFLKKRKRKRKEKTIARFAASPPRLSSTPRMNLYDKYVELRVMYNCWQEKKERKKRGDDWKFRKRRASWERVSRK